MDPVTRSIWKNAGRVLLIIGVGAAFIFLDSRGFHPPTPPEWSLVWTGWILSGISLFYGGKLLRELRAATRQETGRSDPPVPLPVNQHR